MSSILSFIGWAVLPNVLEARSYLRSYDLLTVASSMLPRFFKTSTMELPSVPATRALNQVHHATRSTAVASLSSS